MQSILAASAQDMDFTKYLQYGLPGLAAICLVLSAGLFVYASQAATVALIAAKRNSATIFMAGSLLFLIACIWLQRQPTPVPECEIFVQMVPLTDEDINRLGPVECRIARLPAAPTISTRPIKLKVGAADMLIIDVQSLANKLPAKVTQVTPSLLWTIESN